MGRWQTIGLDIKVEKEKFDRAITRLIAVSPKVAREIVLDASEAFIRSAQKETDPARGRENIPVKQWKRAVITLRDAKNPKSRKRTRYKVPFRRPGKKGRKFFSTKKEANDFARIKYRGAGRAGWWGALLKLGLPLGNIRATPEQMEVATKHNRVVKDLGAGNPWAVITNASKGIGEYSQRSEKWGTIKATNRIKATARAYEKKLAEGWKP